MRPRFLKENGFYLTQGKLASMSKSPLLWLCLSLATIAAYTLVGPAEKTLGANVRIVYLHGAWVWTALAAFVAGCFARPGRPAHRSPGAAPVVAGGWTHRPDFLDHLPAPLHLGHADQLERIILAEPPLPPGSGLYPGRAAPTGGSDVCLRTLPGFRR